MKLIFIPKSWKRKTHNSSQSPTASSSSSRLGSISDPYVRPRNGSVSTTTSTLATPPEKVSFLALHMRQDDFPDRSPVFHPMSNYDCQSRISPEKRDCPSFDSLHVSARPHEPSRDHDLRQHPPEIAHWEPPPVSRPPLSHAVSNPTLSTSSHKSGLPTAVNFNKRTSSSRTRCIRPKRSMPELDGIWKGFLDDVEEDDDSIRLESHLMQDLNQTGTGQAIHKGPKRSSDALEVRSTFQPPSLVPPPSPNKSRDIKFTNFSASTSHLPYLSQDSPPSKVKTPSPKSLGPSSKFPLSLFPTPPPLIPPLPVPDPPSLTSPVRSARQSLPSLHNQSIAGATIPSTTHSQHPPMFVRKHPAPKPLDLHKVPPMVRPSTPDSPLPCTPTSPRFTLFQHSPHSRTAGSPVSILKKTPRGSGNPNPSPTTPIALDYFGSPPTSAQTLSPTGTEMSFTPATPRLARSSYNLRSFASPGSHRATSSESANTLPLRVDGRRRTLSRPEVPVPPRPLQKDAYIVRSTIFAWHAKVRR